MKRKTHIERQYDFSYLREWRKRRGMTVADAARRAGISCAVVSKIERNQSSATLDTLFRLSRVFNMSATNLLALAEARTAQTKRAVRQTINGFQFQIAHFNNVTAYYGEAPKGAAKGHPETHHDEYEVCWVLKGRLHIKLPDEQHILAAGDVIQFDAILEHTYSVMEDCRLLVLHLPKERKF